MLFLASIAHAQTFSKVKENPTINSLISKILDVIVIPIIEGLFIFTILIFIWGVVGLIRNADDPTERKKGRDHILWGVVGMFIMISSYAIIKVIINTVCPPDMLNVCDPLR